MPLPDLIAASGRTPADLATRSGIPAVRWQQLATRPYQHPDGRPWRPAATIVDPIARGLDTTPDAVRAAIREGWPRG